MHLASKILSFFWPGGEANAMYFGHTAWIHSEHKRIYYHLIITMINLSSLVTAVY